ATGMGIEPPLSTIAAGNDAAAALKLAASRGSPALAAAIQAGQFPKTSVYEFGPNDALHAAPAPPKPTRMSLMAEKPPKPQPREVPPSVVAAAAAIGRAVATLPGAGTPVHGQATVPFAAPAAAGRVATNDSISGSQVRRRPVPAGDPSCADAGNGNSIWLVAPGVSAESRVAVRLPQNEFTYIDRPWLHFVTRWAAIDTEILRSIGEAPFSLIDLGSCCGFFSLQAAVAYPQASVFGVEGSVGIGNGTTGLDGTQDQIIATKAVQTHLRWINRLKLPNCFLAPDVWDFKKVSGLAAAGNLCDVLLLLSVVHHVDNVSTDQYAEQGWSRVEARAKPCQAAPLAFLPPFFCRRSLLELRRTPAPPGSWAGSGHVRSSGFLWPGRGEAASDPLLTASPVPRSQGQKASQGASQGRALSQTKLHRSSA
ncbi:unnamed protein product, partial [Symbiodinium necroappetens]